MLKFKSCVLLSLVSSLSYADHVTNTLPTNGIFPVKPVFSIPLVGKQSYDILVEVVPSTSNPLNAFGNDGEQQGLLRNLNAININGNPIAYPLDATIARGMQFLVAGFVYPAGALDHCRKHRKEPCNPTEKPIGNWLCSGWGIAATNENPWPEGKAFTFASIFVNVAVPEEKTPYLGAITGSALELNPFETVGQKFSIPVTGATGSFAGLNPSIIAMSLGSLGNGERVGLRYTVSRNPFAKIVADMTE